MKKTITCTLKGFTLVELLTIIATLCILAALLLPILAKRKIKAIQDERTSSCLQILKNTGIKLNEPVMLTGGWYYLSPAVTNLNVSVGNLLINSHDFPCNVTIYKIAEGRYYGQPGWSLGLQQLKQIVKKASLTNGTFVYFEPSGSD